LCDAQGVLVPGRVSLLMKPGDTCFRGFGRRKGERRRKSVRGCIVSQDLSVLNLIIVKRGESSLAYVPRSCLLRTSCLDLGCSGHQLYVERSRLVYHQDSAASQVRHDLSVCGKVSVHRCPTG